MRVEFNKRLFDVSIPEGFKITGTYAMDGCMVVEAHAQDKQPTYNSPGLTRYFRITDGCLLCSVFSEENT